MKWISVDERLPEHSNVVLVSDEDSLHCYAVALCIEGEWFASNDALLASGYWNDCYIELYIDVAYWCEIKEPKEVSNGMD